MACMMCPVPPDRVPTPHHYATCAAMRHVLARPDRYNDWETAADLLAQA